MSPVTLTYIDKAPLLPPTVFVALAVVEKYYPGFYNWFHTTFTKGMVVGERSAVLARSKVTGDLAGVALLKHTSTENKICTLYVLPAYRRLGIGNLLLDASIYRLSERPIQISVCEEIDNVLSPLIINKGFVNNFSVLGIYRDNVVEYFYVLK